MSFSFTDPNDDVQLYTPLQPTVCPSVIVY